MTAPRLTAAQKRALAELARSPGNPSGVGTRATREALERAGLVRRGVNRLDVTPAGRAALGGAS